MLQAQGQAYEYHTDQGRNAALRDGKSVVNQAPLPVTVEPGLEGLVDQGKEDRRMVVQLIFRILATCNGKISCSW